MPCFHPLHAFVNPYLMYKNSASDVRHITSIKELEHTFDRDKYYSFVENNRDKPDFKYEFSGFPLDEFTVKKFEEVPCGHCLGCRLDHAKEWQTRLFAESQYHTGNYFLTLTYDDQHLKFGELIDPMSLYSPEVVVTGEAPAVSYDDLRKFFMRLRNHFSRKHIEEYERVYFGQFKKTCHKVVIDERPDLTYFAVTEYGSRTHRPHAHAIILGLDQLDWSKADPVKQNFRGEWLYTHPDIVSCWQQGFITIAPINEDTIGYVTRYTLKKSFSNDLTVSQEVSDWVRYFMDIGEWQKMTKYERIQLKVCLKDDIQWQHNLVDGEGFLMPKESQYMSRSEAIGNRYWKDHYQEICRTGELWIQNKQFPIPRSFYLWLKDYDPDFYEEFHDRIVAKQEAKYNLWLQSYDQSYRKEFLEKQGQAIESRSKILCDRRNVDTIIDTKK